MAHWSILSDIPYFAITAKGQQENSKDVPYLCSVQIEGERWENGHATVGK